MTSREALGAALSPPVSRTTVYNWMQRSDWTLPTAAPYAVAKVELWRRRYVDPAKGKHSPLRSARQALRSAEKVLERATGNAEGDLDDPGIDLGEATRRLAVVKWQLGEIKLAREKGEIIPRQDHERAFTAYIGIIRDKLQQGTESLPVSIADGDPNLERRVRRVLQAWYDGLCVSMRTLDHVRLAATPPPGKHPGKRKAVARRRRGR